MNSKLVAQALGHVILGFRKLRCLGLCKRKQLSGFRRAKANIYKKVMKQATGK